MSAKTNQGSSERLSFEDALKRLEQIVRELETGEAKLEQSIALYEEGMQLKALCERKLKDAQLKVEKITLAADGKPTISKYENK